MPTYLRCSTAYSPEGDKIVELAVDAVKEPDAIRGLRNLIILGKTLGSIDPELLEGAAAAVRETVETAHKPDAEPPGLFAILQQLRYRRPGVPSV